MRTTLDQIDIEPEHLQMVAEILRRHLPHAEVWAYGSRVSGHSWEYSDLDLVVVGETALNGREMQNARDDMSESRLPFLVDLKDWHRIPQEWRDEITRCYAVIHSPD